MQPTLYSFQDTLNISMAGFTATLFAFLPKLLSALLIFIIGIAIARIVRNLVVKTLERFELSKSLEKTPVHAFLENSELPQKVEHAIGSVVYWLIILFIVYTSVTVLGLETASTILNRVLFYIPNIFSAVLILIFGTLLAGLAEAVVKGAVRSMDAGSARLMGKVTSYLIVVIAIMAAISELGIAQAFITTLFTGLVAAVSLAFGLAFGLGSKDTVAKMMDEWYSRMKKE